MGVQGHSLFPGFGFQADQTCANSSSLSTDLPNIRTTEHEGTTPPLWIPQDPFPHSLLNRPHLNELERISPALHPTPGPSGTPLLASLLH